jgi:hypothetical protein
MHSIRKSVSYKEIQALAKPKKKLSPLLVEINPIEPLESEDYYSDVSISLISDLSEDPKDAKNELITSVKRNLEELKTEAKSYIDSTDKAIQIATKKLKESVFSVDSVLAEHETSRVLKSLKSSVVCLQDRLEKNEELCDIKKKENENLLEIVKDLESKLRDQVLLRKSKKNFQCECIVI